MKNPQLITIVVGLLLIAGIYFGVRTIPKKKVVEKNETHGQDVGNNQTSSAFTIDTFLTIAKRQLTAEQSARISQLENSISLGAVKDQQIHVFHDLARFYSDTVNAFEPYAWYSAEAARLENSEKSLTFAARLFLENLQNDEVEKRRQWKAFQAKDLFERSLKINPDNDSAKVGLGACFLFGNISATPMEGIIKIREVVEKDSTNIYAQMMLVQGSLISGQYDKAINRLQLVNRREPDNVEAIVLLADIYDRTGDKPNAVIWYRKSLPFVKQPEARVEIEKRIKDLSK